MSKILEYYSREDIQQAILATALHREVAVKFGEKGFGKRPDMLQYPNDVKELGKSGATSFHISEERWKNPLALQPGMSKRQLDDLRIGWDLLIDVDTKFFEIAKIAAHLFIEALKFHDIQNVSVKFSGNNGFHIGIPFEAFPERVNNTSTYLLFPEGPKIIASYLKDMIKEHLSAAILEKYSADELAEKTGKSQQNFIINKKLDPFKLVDIDTVLISNRHMFRAPYSLNEKSGLVSIPLEPERILSFKKQQASLLKIKPKLKFLDASKLTHPEAANLITQAFDWESKKSFVIMKEEGKKQTQQHYEPLKNKIQAEHFPHCIQKGLRGMEDGKKRFLFILINFLRNTGYDLNEIESITKEWNQKNPEPLRENYLFAQLSWHKRQKQSILPPNCSNHAYYLDLGLKCPEEVCQRFKNPVNAAIRRAQAMQKEKKPKKTRKKSS